MNVPIGNMTSLGKTAGWRKLFGNYADELGSAMTGIGEARPIINPAQMSSRGFAGIGNRNPLSPEFAGKGINVEQGAWNPKNLVNPRVRKTTIGRNDAAEAAEALRAEHVDSSRLGKLKRLLAQGAASGPGMGVLAGLGGAGIGAAAMGMQGAPEQQGGFPVLGGQYSESEQNPELERILQMQGGMY